MQSPTPRTLTVRVHGKPYTAVLTPDLVAGGYSIQVPELPGLSTEADSLPEAKRMLREGIALHLVPFAR